MSARVMPHKSACPEAIIFSAAWGWLMRPATMTGMLSFCLKRMDAGARYACFRVIGGAMWMAPARVLEVPVVMLI